MVGSVSTDSTLGFGIHQSNKTHQRIFLRMEKKEELVVVMSAVDWWKSEETAVLARFFDRCVRWNFLRECGKGEVQASKGELSAKASTKHPHDSHAMFTRCAHGRTAK
jgi:hypothetical protein